MESVKNRNVRRTAKVRISLFSLISLTLTVALASCDRECLCHLKGGNTDAKVSVNADWRVFDKETPTGMTLLHYRSEDGYSQRTITHNTENIRLKLTHGTYDFLLFNQTPSEFGSIRFESLENPKEANATGNTISTPSWVKTENITIVEPEWLAVGHYNNLSISKEMTAGSCNCVNCSCKHPEDNGPSLSVDIEPTNIIWTLDIKVNIRGFGSLAQTRGVIDGVYGGRYLTTLKPTEQKALHVLEKWTVNKVDSDKAQLSISTRCFGIPETDTRLIIQMMLKDGKTIVNSEIDCQGLIEYNHNEQTASLNLTLTEPLPDVKPSTGTGGFDASVDDWGDNHEFDIEF